MVNIAISQQIRRFDSCSKPKNLKREIIKKLTQKQKEVLKQIIENKCEMCHKPEEQTGTLNAHRINRGAFGGSYHFRNVMFICKSCHKKIHYKEF